MLHDVLCQCGWGLLSVTAEQVPIFCPLCGYCFKPEEV